MLVWTETSSETLVKTEITVVWSFAHLPHYIPAQILCSSVSSSKLQCGFLSSISTAIHYTVSTLTDWLYKQCSSHICTSKSCLKFNINKLTWGAADKVTHEKLDASSSTTKGKGHLKSCPVLSQCGYKKVVTYSTYLTLFLSTSLSSLSLINLPKVKKKSLFWFFFSNHPMPQCADRPFRLMRPHPPVVSTWRICNYSRVEAR